MEDYKSEWGFFVEVDQTSQGKNKPVSHSVPSIPTNTRYASSTLFFGGPSTVGSPRAREKTFFDYFFSEQDVSLLCGGLSVSRALAQDLCSKGFMSMEHLREANFDLLLAIVSEHEEVGKCVEECHRILACASQPLRRSLSPQRSSAGCSEPRDSDGSVQTTAPAESTTSSEYFQGADGVKKEDQDRRRLDILSNGQEARTQDDIGSVSGSSITSNSKPFDDSDYDEMLFPMDEEGFGSYAP